MVSQLKDFKGHDALDFGTQKEMSAKYPDNLIVEITDKPFGG